MPCTLVNNSCAFHFASFANLAFCTRFHVFCSFLDLARWELQKSTPCPKQKIAKVLESVILCLDSLMSEFSISQTGIKPKWTLFGHKWAFCFLTDALTRNIRNFLLSETSETSEVSASFLNWIIRKYKPVNLEMKVFPKKSHSAEKFKANTLVLKFFHCFYSHKKQQKT